MQYITYGEGVWNVGTKKCEGLGHIPHFIFHHKAIISKQTIRGDNDPIGLTGCATDSFIYYQELHVLRRSKCWWVCEKMALLGTLNLMYEDIVVCIVCVCKE